MDRLKNFIENNRPEFDEVELPEGHLERFKEKLERKRTPFIRRKLVWLVAAVACLGLLFTVAIQYQPEKENNVCELNGEINEVRMYYNMQLAATISDMEELYKQKQAPGALELMQQTHEVIASNRDFEEKILPTLPCSEAALFAMNQHYDASIAGMHILLQQMQNVVNDTKN